MVVAVDARSLPPGRRSFASRADAPRSARRARAISAPTSSVGLAAGCAGASAGVRAGARPPPLAASDQPLRSARVDRLGARKRDRRSRSPRPDAARAVRCADPAGRRRAGTGSASWRRRLRLGGASSAPRYSSRSRSQVLERRRPAVALVRHEREGRGERRRLGPRATTRSSREAGVLPEVGDLGQEARHLDAPAAGRRCSRR